MSEFEFNSEVMEQKRLEGKILCEKYVLGNIPPAEIAKFLGIGIDTLRALIQQNAFSFAFPYTVGMSDQGRCIIPALRFWDWLKCRL